jgi:hypothetical protein
VHLNIVEILRTGALGFGFLLAYLAYRLLSKEQLMPRASRAKLVKQFMWFALILVLVADAGEAIKYWPSPKLPLPFSIPPLLPAPPHCVIWDSVNCHACEFAVRAGNVGLRSDVADSPFICEKMIAGKRVSAEFVGAVDVQRNAGGNWIILYLCGSTCRDNDPHVSASGNDGKNPIWSSDLKATQPITNGRSEWKLYLDQCASGHCRVEGTLTVIEPGYHWPPP